jgi:tellurite resistance protein TerC
MGRFHYLKMGLAGLLFFVGMKMLIHGVYKISTNASLIVILSILVLSVVASQVRTWRKRNSEVAK